MGVNGLTLHAATFNVRNGRAWDGVNSWPLRRRATASAISRLEADVVGLQEVYEFQRRYLARQLGGRWSGAGRFGARKGEQCPVAVFADRITVVDHATRWFGPTSDVPGTRLPGASFPRIATLVTCHDAETASDVLIVNVHLDEHVPENRAAATTQLEEWIGDAVPSVVMGDFNTTADDHAVTTPLTSRGFQLAAVSGGTAHEFTGGDDGRAIDHIWFSSHWEIEAAEVVRARPHGRLPSDHWPVRAMAHLAD